jgi:hypothetical protein
MSIRFKLADGTVIDAPKNRKNLDEVRRVRADLIRHSGNAKRIYREVGYLRRD